MGISFRDNFTKLVVDFAINVVGEYDVLFVGNLSLQVNALVI